MEDSEQVRSMDEYLKEDEEVELPGFRFHPTDEELVSFYLRRKLDRKPISIELIKQIDIYKYDPWDLPKASSTGGEKEWYFYCKRGRKYRNSVRPNRVTGSGFWKATGIDKPVYSLAREATECESNIVGLKKTLVYYRGSAGKGTKTEWMMHEFRLPPNHTTTANYDTTTTTSHQAEIWTLCRIFKRNTSERKSRTHWSRHLATKRNSIEKGIRSMSSSTVESCNSTITNNNNNQEAYINFGGSHEQKPDINNHTSNYNYNYNYNDRRSDYNEVNHVSQLSHSLQQQPHQYSTPQPPSSSSALTSFWINQASNDLFASENSWEWDELGSVVQFPLHFDSMM